MCPFLGAERCKLPDCDGGDARVVVVAPLIKIAGLPRDVEDEELLAVREAWGGDGVADAGIGARAGAAGVALLGADTGAHGPQQRAAGSRRHV